MDVKYNTALLQRNLSALETLACFADRQMVHAQATFSNSGHRKGETMICCGQAEPP